MTKKNIFKILASAIVLGAGLGTIVGCSLPDGAPDADKAQARVVNQSLNEARKEVGYPAIKNFSELRQQRDLYELRDKDILTWVYLKGIDGRLLCLGRAVGYGIPYGVQYSNPQRVETYQFGGNRAYITVPQAEPNGLYTPGDVDGTWIRLLDPETHKAKYSYVEPHVVVSPFRIMGRIVSAQCPANMKVAK